MDKPKSMTTPNAVSLPSVFADPQSQMTLAERAAMEGILRELQPALSIELGTAKGASLRRIAAHSGEVHAFDLTLGVIPDEFPNVRFHTGDSHVLLRQVLADFEREARTVDFALVDGDHSVTGVRRDLDDLLSSSAVSGTVILLHDCLNEGVREGISQVRIESDPRIRYVDLNFVPRFRRVRAFDEVWAGLGIVVVDGDRFSMDREHREMAPLWAGLHGHVVRWRLAQPWRRIRRAAIAAFRAAQAPGVQLPVAQRRRTRDPAR